uniref:Membrane frizzled-related protein n=1 Tax=Mus musculus TaxID=10090 RepID=A0A0U1RNN1_MOUSE
MKDYDDVILRPEASELSKPSVSGGYSPTATSPGSVFCFSVACCSCCWGYWWLSSWLSCRLHPSPGLPRTHCSPEASPPWVSFPAPPLTPPPPPPLPPQQGQGSRRQP